MVLCLQMDLAWSWSDLSHTSQPGCSGLRAAEFVLYVPNMPRCWERSDLFTEWAWL